MNKNFIHKTKQNYKEDTTASSLMLMIISKQGGPKPTSKDPKTLLKKDNLAREWAALFAPLGIQVTWQPRISEIKLRISQQIPLILQGTFLLKGANALTQSLESLSTIIAATSILLAKLKAHLMASNLFARTSNNLSYRICWKNILRKKCLPTTLVKRKCWSALHRLKRSCQFKQYAPVHNCLLPWVQTVRTIIFFFAESIPLFSKDFLSSFWYF